jgi:RecJ-like exonuclease
MTLLAAAQAGAKLLREHAFVRVVARDEPDAYCAAALLAHALRREGIDFHATWTARLDGGIARQLAEERNDALVLIGLGGDAEDREPTAGRKLVIDQDAEPLPGEAALADDAALASLAYLVAVGLGARNADLAPLALAGAVAAGRHVLGPAGLDARVLDEATASGVVVRGTALGLRGSSLLAALSQLDAPAVPGLTGRAHNAKKLVAELQLTGEAPPDALAPSDAERLGSVLALRLLQQGAGDAALDALYRPRLAALKGPHTGHDAAQLAALAEAAAIAGRGGLALAALWPDEAAGAELADLAAAQREDLVAALLKAERDAKRDGDVLVCEAATPAYAAPLADRAALALLHDAQLAVARAPEGADHVALALRAYAPRKDVARLAREAARACGGSAHGDARRARARVPAAEEERFRKLLAEGYA